MPQKTRWPRYRIRNYSPKTRKVTLITTLDSLGQVKRFLKKEHGGNVDPTVESSKKPRIYIQKILGQRKNGTLITRHVSIDA